MIDGFSQERQGRQMMEGLERPRYETPQEIDQVLALAQQLASGPMPGMGMMQQQLGANLGSLAYNATTATSSSADALAALVSGHGANAQAQQGLAIESARDRRQMQQLQQQALQLRASYRDREFADRFGEFQDAANMAMGMQQAGRTNIYSGLEGMGRVVGQGALASGIMGGDLRSGGDVVTNSLINSDLSRSAELASEQQRDPIIDVLRGFMEPDQYMKFQSLINPAW